MMLTIKMSLNSNFLSKSMRDVLRYVAGSSMICAHVEGQVIFIHMPWCVFKPSLFRWLAQFASPNWAWVLWILRTASVLLRLIFTTCSVLLQVTCHRICIPKPSCIVTGRNQTTSALIRLSWGTKPQTPYNPRLTRGYRLSTILPTIGCGVLL